MPVRSGDQRQDVSEHLSRHRDLGQLERDVAPVADKLGADLDQLVAPAGQGPRLRRPRHRLRVHEVAEVKSQGMELKTHSIGAEGSA